MGPARTAALLVMGTEELPLGTLSSPSLNISQIGAYYNLLLWLPSERLNIDYMVIQP